MHITFEYNDHLECQVPKLPYPYEMFGEWLFSDIQTVESVGKTIDACELVLARKASQLELDGNVYIAVIEPEGVMLVNMYTGRKSEHRLDLKQAIGLIGAWKSHLVKLGC